MFAEYGNGESDVVYWDAFPCGSEKKSNILYSYAFPRRSVGTRKRGNEKIYYTRMHSHAGAWEREKVIYCTRMHSHAGAWERENILYPYAFPRGSVGTRNSGAW